MNTIPPIGSIPSWNDPIRTKSAGVTAAAVEYAKEQRSSPHPPAGRVALSALIPELHLEIAAHLEPRDVQNFALAAPTTLGSLVGPTLTGAIEAAKARDARTYAQATASLKAANALPPRWRTGVLAALMASVSTIRGTASAEDATIDTVVDAIAKSPEKEVWDVFNQFHESVCRSEEQVHRFVLIETFRKMPEDFQKRFALDTACRGLEASFRASSEFDCALLDDMLHAPTPRTQGHQTRLRPIEFVLSWARDNQPLLDRFWQFIGFPHVVADINANMLQTYVRQAKSFEPMKQAAALIATIALVVRAVPERAIVTSGESLRALLRGDIEQQAARLEGDERKAVDRALERLVDGRRR
jgi:hypothetical protein